MNNWRAISQIAVIFGIVFIIFAAFSAFISYQQIVLDYSPFIPNANVIQVSILSAMLPFMLMAILSFVVAAIGSRAAKEAAEKETPPQLQPTSA